MKQVNDIEFFLVDTTGANDKAVMAGLAWLDENGGGCVAARDKLAMMRALDIETDGQLKKVTAGFGRRGVTLSWDRRKLHYGLNNLVALYMGKEVDEVVRYSDFERVFIVPWAEGESEFFKMAYKPIVVEIGEDNGLVPVPEQPEWQSTEGLIPAELDRILCIIAGAVEGYGGDLQKPERELFKADLKNYRRTWVAVDPKDVFRRCIDLGMPAKVADEVGGMVKKLREGHNYRPAPGYERGWIHRE